MTLMTSQSDVRVHMRRLRRAVVSMAAWFWCAAFKKDYHNLPWYWCCFRERVRLGGKGRFWCAACNSVNRTCSTSTLLWSYDGLNSQDLEILWAFFAFFKKQSLSNCRYCAIYCADRMQNLPGQPHIWLTLCLHPNWFTFGRVIAERVNTIFAPLSISNIGSLSL